MKDIRTAVDNFKARNGGSITFTTKEIVIAIWERLDDVKTKTDYNSAAVKILSVITCGVIIKLVVFNN